MNYGELKSAWMVYIEKIGLKPDLFDCVEWLDKSEKLIAAALPSTLVHELVRVYTTSPETSAARDIALPGDYFSLISVRMATERSSGTNVPIYRPCPIIEPSEYLSKVQWADEERFCAIFNQMIHFNPDPADAVADKPGSIELAYKRKPATLFDRENNTRMSISIDLEQHDDNVRIFHTPDGNKWSDYGMSAEDLIGGHMYYTNTNRSALLGGVIDNVWDDVTEDWSYLHIREGSTAYEITGGTLSNCIVIERLVVVSIGNPVYRADNEVPEINENYHGLILDLAIGSYVIGFKPDIGKVMMDAVFKSIGSVGGQLDPIMGANK